MAHVSTHAPAAHGILHAIADAFAAIGRALTTIPVASSKMRQIEALMALSDAELADRGMRREDIARHVMGGCYM